MSSPASLSSSCAFLLGGQCGQGGGHAVIFLVQVMGAGADFASAAAWAATNLTFDIDRRVHTFELTIRAVGGLLSAHVLATADATLLPGRRPDAPEAGPIAPPASAC